MKTPNTLILSNFILIVSILFLLDMEIYPQYSLSGIVKEKRSGEILIGATVTLKKDSIRSSKVITGAVSNSYGYYSLPNIKSGEYFVLVSVVGYKSIVQKLILTDLKNVKINFELEKKSVLMNEIVVEGNHEVLLEQDPSVISVNPDIVQKLPSMGGETDLFRALQLLPGISSSNEISTGIYVRGSSAGENLSLIDGVNIYNPSHLGGFASTFNGDAIKKINVIKGSFPAEYGGRLSSVLDVIMKEGNREEVKGNISLNTISSKVSLEGPLDTNMTFILSARMMYLDKILPISQKFDKIPLYNFFDLNGKVNYIFSEKNRIFINAFHSSDRIKEPKNSPDVSMGINWDNTAVNLSWINITSPSVFATTSLMYTNYTFSTLLRDKNSTSNTTDFFTSSEINDVSLKREMQFFLGDIHNIKTGGEFLLHYFNITKSDYFIQELLYKDYFGKEINALEASLFIEDNYKMFNDLNINGGARLYYFKNSNFISLEPRLSFVYSMYERFALKGSISVAHQTLHLLTRTDVYLPSDVWYPSTNVIKPSRAIQGTMGFEAFSLNNNYMFTFETYYKDLINVYEYKAGANFQNSSDFDNQLTKGNGFAYGLEMFLNKRTGAFNGWIGYTLAWTKRKFGQLDNDEYFYPKFDRRHDISIVLTYEPSKSLNFGASWVYSTGQTYSLPVGQYSFENLGPVSEKPYIYYSYSAPDDMRLPPFHKLDLSANYNFYLGSSSLTLSLNIYNVYNRYNAFSKYMGYKVVNNVKIPVLRQFTLFPFLPTIGIKMDI